MPDNINITPGVGAAIAADDVGGVLHQQVKLTLGGDGVSEGSVSSGNPLPIAAVGELIEALEAVRYRLGALASAMATISPDVSGKMRAILSTDSTLGTVSSVTGVGTVTSVTGVGTVTTVSAVTAVNNQVNMGGLSAIDIVPALIRAASDQIRSNITVT